MNLADHIEVTDAPPAATALLSDVAPGTVVEFTYERPLYIGEHRGRYTYLWVNEAAFRRGERWVVMWDGRDHRVALIRPDGQAQGPRNG